MNNKANKQQIQFPPLLNLCKDRPHIDATMQNWEKVNAPYLNDMISPVYIKDNGEEGVYDKTGAKHTISGGYWYRNGERIGYKDTALVKEDFDTEGRDIISGTKLGDSHGFLHLRNKQLYLWIVGERDILVDATGTILDARIFDAADGEAIIGVYSRADSDYVAAFVYSNGSITKRFENIAKWRNNLIRTEDVSSRIVNTVSVTPYEIDPVCNAYVYDKDYFVITWINKYGSLLDGRHNGFITYSVGPSAIRDVATSGPNNDVTVNYIIKEEYKQDWICDVGRFTANSYAFGSTTYENEGCVSYVYLSEYAARMLQYTDAQGTGISGWYRIEGWNATAAAASRFRIVQGPTSRPNLDGTYTEFSNSFEIKRKNDNNTYRSSFTVYATQLRKRNLLCTFEGRPEDFWNVKGFNSFEEYYMYINVNGLPSRGYHTDGWQGQPFNVTSISYNYDDWYREEDTLNYDLAGMDEMPQLNFDVDVWYTSRVGSGGDPFRETSYANPTISGRIEADNGDRSYAWRWMTEAAVGSSNLLSISETSEREVTGNLLLLPNVAVGDRMMPMFDFSQSTTQEETFKLDRGSSSSTTPYAMIVQATIDDIDEFGNIRFDEPVEAVYFPWTDDGWVPRSASFTANQDYFAMAFKATSGAMSPAQLVEGASKPSDFSTAKAIEIYSNSTMDGVKYNFGSSRWVNFNYYSDYLIEGSVAGGAEDRLIYNLVGARTTDYGFRLLYNTTASGTSLQGISFAPGNVIGTMVTPWQGVQESYYITINSNEAIFRDESGKWVRVYTDYNKSDGLLKPILNGRYILLQTTAFYNLYDSERNLMLHYASDWNFRTLFGTYYNDTTPIYSGSGESTVEMWYARSVAASQNQIIARSSSRTNYSRPDVYPTASFQVPLYTKVRLKNVGDVDCLQANSDSYNLTTAKAVRQGIDVYYSRNAGTTADAVASAYYQFTQLDDNKIYDNQLNNTTYVISSSSTAFVNPGLFATYMDGAGNNDLVVEGGSAYTVNYYNNELTFLYPVSSQISNASAFFVIQGQFYAIIEDKICAVNYTNNVLSSKEPIIDISGMKFVGNNPMIAFFWSERYRSFYSFTGDAILEHLYNADKFSGITGDYYYDESSQSIFVPNNQGLLVFGPKNTFILEQFKNTDLVQFTDDNLTHIEDNGKDYALTYYKADGYEVNDLDLETSFFGKGATDSTSIDRWNITLYDLEGDHPSGDVTVGVRSLTDITVKSEEKKLHITPEMWDKWSNSILIGYNPKLIKGQGIRLYVKSPFIIQSVTAHVMDNGNGTATNKRSMV